MRKTTWIALMFLGAIVYVSSCNKIEIPPQPNLAPAPTGYVDLGLPSETLWASCNSGADSITELGITYTAEEALKLDYQLWRLPTVAEIEELIDNCKWEWSEYDKGFLVTSKRKGYEDRTIFLPANANSFEAMYWTSTTYKQDKKDFLASLQCKYDDVRDRTKTPTVYTNNLSSTTSYPVRLVRKVNKQMDKPYVNLGLTSELKWGWYNIGATSDLVGYGKPEGYGDYFAWGDTTTYYKNWKGEKGNTIADEQWKEEYKGTGYTWANYTFIKDGYTGGDDDLPTKEDFTKYASGILTLKPEDDVVSVRMGEGWRIPRKEEFEELYNECYWEWTKNFNGTGVAGYIVYKSQDKATDYQMTKEGTHTYSMTKDLYIFLPAAGYLQGKDFGNANVDGYYWSCELKPESPYEAYSLTFDDTGVYIENESENSFRYLGQPVRPVYIGK